MIITHISPRYGSSNNKQSITESELLAEAQSVFPETILAEDFMEYEI